jgi:phage FluMu gp28-like protein
MNITYNRPKLTDYQAAILDSEARFTITEAATKTGKTASHIIWLFEQAIQLKQNQTAWWVAPVYGTAMIAFNRMRNQVSDRNFFKVNETKMTLTTPVGSIIQFKSAEKPDNLYGDDVYCAIFDEFTRAREDAWFALRSTLTATGGRCKFIGNVKGKKNWGHKLAMRAKGGEPGYEYHKITAYDAAKYSELTGVTLEEIEQAKRDLPEYVFNELYLAEAGDNQANPFGIDAIRTNIAPLSLEPAVCYGVDLAKSTDHTVIIGLDRMGRTCFFERFQKDWQQTQHRVIEVIGQKPAMIDSTGVGDPITEEIQRKCSKAEGMKFTSQSKQQLMEGLAVMIQKNDIRYPAGVIVDELEAFEFEYTRTGVRYSAPSGMHDDCVCALALAVEKFRAQTHAGRYYVRGVA